MKIDLTAEEQAWADAIEFDALRLTPETYPANSDLAFKLGDSILKRGAVPDHRRHYFNDAAYNIGGRGKSRKERWAANGTKTYSDVLRHPHFLEILRYFIFGPAMHAGVVDAFRARVDACFGRVTSSDVAPLGKFARELWRSSGKIYNADQFYQLALECGISNHYAPNIYDAVRTAR